MSLASLLPAGIEPQGNTVLEPAHFTVQTVDAGVGEVLVYIEDPEGHTEEVQRGARAEGSAGDWNSETVGRICPGIMGSTPCSVCLLPRRPEWSRTTTRTAHTPSPMCPRSLAYTRYSLSPGLSALPHCHGPPLSLTTSLPRS